MVVNPNPLDEVQDGINSIEQSIAKGAADAEAVLSKTAADAEAALLEAEAMVSKSAADAEAALSKSAAEVEAALTRSAADTEAMLSKSAADVELALAKTAEEVAEKVRADVQIISDVSNEAISSVGNARAAAEAEVMEKIAEAASKQTAAMSALTGGFTGGLISKLPGGLLLKRSIEIWAFTADIAMKMAAAQRSGERERKLEVSEDLCEGLLRLGPTFIKLGQILSTRYDILPCT